MPSPQQPTTLHKDTSNQNQDQDKPKPEQVVMTPKLARAGPKIFDKVRAFEERRSSVDPVAGCGRNVDDTRDKGEGGRLQGAAQKRTAFKQRASSLEEKTSYSQKVQSYQSKFTEELERIKKLVGKPRLKKSYSTEQLPQRERLVTGRLEPIPPQVVKKLEARERAMDVEGGGLGKAPGDQSLKRDAMTQLDPAAKPAERSSHAGTGKISVAVETAPVHQLPGQPLATATRMRLPRFG